MMDALKLTDFLEPVNPYFISNDEGYANGQIGESILQTNPQDAQVVLVGCHEWRGAALAPNNNAADAIRKCFYQLYYWHTEIAIADIGNIKPGATLADSYAALKTVCKALMQAGKKVVVMGGSHDNMLAQYEAFANQNKIIDVTVVDALIDLKQDTPLRSQSFLLPLLTTEPNYVRHYNHIGFQGYFVHPQLLETIDKLRFDCYRLGKVQEHIEEMEPVIRNSHLLGFDINAIAHAYAPANTLSPNGLNGVEACKLLQYAGMAAQVETVGLYGFNADNDHQNLTANQIAQMIWYYVDGLQKQLHEASLHDKTAYNEYTTAFAEVKTLFLQSKNTGRWWMQMPNKKFTACSYSDYLTASNNELPERWLREQERN